MRLTRKHIRGILQVTVSVVLLAVALRQVHWSDLRAALSSVQPGWLLLAWALFILGVFVRAGRWQVLLNALGVRRPFRELSLWYFVGGFFNVILPTGFGGDAVRVVEVAADSGRTAAAVNSVLVDRYLGLITLLFMGIVAGLLRPDLAPPASLPLIALLFVGGIVAAWLISRPWWARWGEGDRPPREAHPRRAPARHRRVRPPLHRPRSCPRPPDLVRLQLPADRLDRRDCDRPRPAVALAAFLRLRAAHGDCALAPLGRWVGRARADDRHPAQFGRRGPGAARSPCPCACMPSPSPPASSAACCT